MVVSCCSGNCRPSQNLLNTLHHCSVRKFHSVFMGAVGWTRKRASGVDLIQIWLAVFGTANWIIVSVGSKPKETSFRRRLRWLDCECLTHDCSPAVICHRPDPSGLWAPGHDRVPVSTTADSLIHLCFYSFMHAHVTKIQFTVCFLIWSTIKLSTKVVTFYQFQLYVVWICVRISEEEPLLFFSQDVN